MVGKRGGALRRYPAAYLVGLLTLMVLLQFLNTVTHGTVKEALRNHFVSTAAGQWWRLFTGQLIHLDWTHLTMDAAAIAIVWGPIARRYSAARLLMVFLLAGTIGQLFGFLAWQTGLTRYAALAGSSDALHGLFYLYLRDNYSRTTRSGSRYVCLIGIALMLAAVLYTCATGVMPLCSSLASPGYNHLGGILVFVIALEFHFLNPQQESRYET